MRVDPIKVGQLLKDLSIPFSENAEVFLHIKCPSCEKEKGYITKRKGVFSCWVCKDSGVFGSCERWLAKISQKPVSWIAEKIKKEYDGIAEENCELELSDEDDEEIMEESLELYRTVWPTDFFEIDSILSRAGRSYLEGRGISVDMAKKYGVKYSTYHKRVCFPIETSGVFLGYQGRLVGPEKGTIGGLEYRSAKYLTSKNVPRERAVMFHNRLEGSPHAIVAEGPIDAIKLDLCGGNIATIGKNISQGQIKLIQQSVVYLALDPDAYTEIVKNATLLQSIGKQVYVIQPPKDKKDFGECSYEESYRCFLEAKPFQDWNDSLELT